MIRHSISEAIALLRHRALVGLALAAALAVPIALGGLTLFLGTWLEPFLQDSTPATTVNVLLRPEVTAEEREVWIEDLASKHPGWKLETLPPDRLGERLSRWFPYLRGLLSSDGQRLLPTLVEVLAENPEEIAVLEGDPKVLAIGPTSPLRQVLRTAGRRIAAALITLTIGLLLAAVLLAAVWTHLEMYRHADEITIQRLVGATETAIRGPFLAVISAMGILAGLLGAGLTLIMASGIQKTAVILGLPRPGVSPWIPALQLLTATLLPLSTWIDPLASSQRGEVPPAHAADPLALIQNAGWVQRRSRRNIERFFCKIKGAKNLHGGLLWYAAPGDPQAEPSACGSPAQAAAEIRQERRFWTGTR